MQPIPLLLAHLPKGSKGSGAHYELVEALIKYHGLSHSRITTSWREFLAQLRWAQVVYFQKSGLSNIFLALLSRLAGRRTILYLHEPLTTSQRRNKGVPWLKAHLITVFQRVETRVMHELFTGNAENRFFFGQPLRYAPLLLTKGPTPGDWGRRSSALLYFGRLDTEKYYDEFRRLSLKKKVVATQNLNIKDNEHPVAKVSVDEKEMLFSRHRFVWCVQRHWMTQSAVVLDALRYSCCCLVREDDPITTKLLPSEYIPIPKSFTSEQIADAIRVYEEHYADGPILDGSFAQLCGVDAYRRHWKSLLVISPAGARS